MKKFIYSVLGLLIIGFTFYNTNLRAKFYIQYGIWLPSYCNNIEFKESPGLMTILGIGGDGATAIFEIKKEEIESFIESIDPQDLWLKYSELDSTLTDRTIHHSEGLPEEVLDGQIKVMLWSSDTKRDYYNIWLLPSKDGKIKVSISIPFT